MWSRTRLIIGAICVVYIAARIWRLDESCLWFDEIFSVHAAEHSWNSLFWFVAQDLIHPPLFYVLLKIWIGLGGESVFWLRLLPVLLSIFAIFPFVRLCRELKLETQVLLLSLFLLAVNGALIKYAQTVRMYSMLMFLGLVSMWLFARYFNRGKSFVPLVIANVLLVYTHYYGWLVIGTEIAAILIFQRIKWRRMAVMFGVVAAVFAPWAIAVLQAARSGSDLAQNIGWQSRPVPRELLSFALDLVEPFYFQASSIQPASMYAISLPVLIICTIAAIAFALRWRREKGNNSIYLLTLFTALPIIVAFTASWLFPKSIWGTRHLIIALPPAIVLIAHSILSPAVGAFRVIAVSLLIVLSAAASVIYVAREMPFQVWCEWNDVAAEVRLSGGPDSEEPKIYAFEDLVAYHLWFALRDTRRAEIGVIKDVKIQTNDPAYFLPRGFTGVRKFGIDEITDENILLVFRTSDPGAHLLLIEKFTAAGYETCQTRTSEQHSTRVWWVKMARRPGCEPR